MNLTGGTVTCVRPAPPCSQPTLSLHEQIECEQAVLTSPLFQSALEKHYGIRDASLVMVDIWSAGYYGSEEERTQRLTRPLCFLRSVPTDNGYARPLAGIRPIVPHVYSAPGRLPGNAHSLHRLSSKTKRIFQSESL